MGTYHEHIIQQLLSFNTQQHWRFEEIDEGGARRLVLEAWDKLEASGELLKPYGKGDMVESELHLEGNPLLPLVQPMPNPKVAERAKPELKKEAKAVEEDPAQPMLSDFGFMSVWSTGRW